MKNAAHIALIFCRYISSPPRHPLLIKRGGGCKALSPLIPPLKNIKGKGG